MVNSLEKQMVHSWVNSLEPRWDLEWASRLFEWVSQSVLVLVHSQETQLGLQQLLGMLVMLEIEMELVWVYSLVIQLELEWVMSLVSR